MEMKLLKIFTWYLNDMSIWGSSKFFWYLSKLTYSDNFCLYRSGCISICSFWKGNLEVEALWFFSLIIMKMLYLWQNISACFNTSCFWMNNEWHIRLEEKISPIFITSNVTPGSSESFLYTASTTTTTASGRE